MIDMKYDSDTNTLNDEKIESVLSIIEKHKIRIDDVLVLIDKGDEVYGVVIDTDWSTLPQINKIKSKCRVNGLARHLSKMLPISVKW